MNGSILCAAILCSIVVFSAYAQDQSDDLNSLAMAKRYRQFAFAKRFDSLGYNFGFAKRSADTMMPVENVDEGVPELEKRARFAFAKRARFAFAKRARFAFA